MKIFAVFFALYLAGCGPQIQVVNVDPRDASGLDQSVPVFTAGQAPPDAVILGPLTATSCKNKLWDPAATRENAMSQLKLLARQAGGNAVANVSCDAPYGTSTRTNCWESIICRGTAITIKD